MDQHNATPDTEPSSVGRRTVLKGAAWSVPVVAVVGATPVFAASNLKVAVTAASATSGTGKTVTFKLTVKNPNTIAVTINSVTIPAAAGQWASFGPATISSSPWAASSTANTITFVGTEGDNSAAFDSFTITLVDSRTGYNLNVTLSGSHSSTGGAVTFV